MKHRGNGGMSGRGTNHFSSAVGRSRRQRLALAFAAAGAILPCGHVFGQALFTTESDFTGWTAHSPATAVTAVPNTTFDYDGQATNGLANYNSGAAGTPGGLEINTGSNALGYGPLATSPFNDLYQTSFLNAVDPGATAGSTVAYSGTLYMVYTTPTFAGPDVYFNLGLQINYPGDSYYGAYYFPTSTAAGATVDGMATTIATYSYSISAGGGGNLSMNIVTNAGVYGTGVAGTNNVLTAPLYIDDISTTYPVAANIPPNNATWATNGNGNWSTSPSDAGNWVNSAPPANSSSTATFGTDGGTITVTPTVTVVGAQAVTELIFSSPNGYALAGSTVSISSELLSTAGQNTINSLNIGTATVSISTGSSVTATTFAKTNYQPLNLTGGGTLNVPSVNNGNLALTGGSTLNITGNGTVAAGAAFLYDINVDANSTVNLGTNNVYDDNSIDGAGTIAIGSGSTLTTAEYNGYTFNGSLSGSGSLILGSVGGASSAGAPYTGTFYGTSPTFSGPISVTFLDNLAVGTGVTLGNASSTNTITLDSGTLQAVGNANLAQNITIEDTQGIVNNTTVINTSSTTGTVTVGNTLTLSGHISGGNSIQKTGIGTLVLGASNSYSGGTDVTAGTLLVGAAHGLPTNNALTISNGAEVQLGASTGVETLSSLSIDSLSTLDITNNHIIIDYSGSDPISSIAALIKSGYNSGTWTGLGITSSAAAANSASYGIGYADGASGVVPGLSSGQIEIMYTLLGDANLDGKVNGTDFTLMAANFNDSVTAGWDRGDFNYSNTVNGDDFVLLADNFNQFASQSDVAAADLAALDSFAVTNGISLTSVPEPATLGLVVLAGVGALGRRNRRQKRE